MLRLGGHGHPEPADNRDISTNGASPLTAEVGGWPGGSVAVTVNDVLDGHVVLDECLDRIDLNGYMPDFEGGRGSSIAGPFRDVESKAAWW